MKGAETVNGNTASRQFVSRERERKRGRWFVGRLATEHRTIPFKMPAVFN